MSEFEILEEDDYTSLLRNGDRYYFRASLGGGRLLHNIVAPEIFKSLLEKAESKGAKPVRIKLAELGDGQNVIVLEVQKPEVYEDMRRFFYESLVEGSLSSPAIFLQIVNSELLRMQKPPQGC